MTPSAFSLPINAPAETVWALLKDEMTNPERYDDQISHLRVASSTDKEVTRTLRRDGVSWEEHLQANVEALMVEHIRRTGDGFEVTVIHQVVPMAATALLNLAATISPLDKDPENTQGLIPDLEARAHKFKALAESL